MKGQWFIISAVIATASMAGISSLFKGYFFVSTSDIGLYDEGFYFQNIRDGFIRTVAMTEPQTCERNIEQYKQFVVRTMASMGYLLNITNEECPDPADVYIPPVITYISVTSDKSYIWQGEP